MSSTRTRRTKKEGAATHTEVPTSRIFSLDLDVTHVGSAEIDIDLSRKKEGRDGGELRSALSPFFAPSLAL